MNSQILVILVVEHLVIFSWIAEIMICSNHLFSDVTMGKHVFEDKEIDPGVLEAFRWLGRICSSKGEEEE